MATAKIQSGASSEGEVKQPRESIVSTSPMRISHKTKAKLEHLLRQANKNRIGRRVKAEDLISHALGLMTDRHIAEICDKALSNKDRMELLYRKISKEKRGMSRDEFFGILLAGAVNAAGNCVAVAAACELNEPAS